MAKISLSPLVVDIRNKVADAVFSKWKGINYIRSRVVPSNPRTTEQTAVRQAFARLVNLWQLESAYGHSGWNFWVQKLNKSGFNAFIGENVPEERVGQALLWSPDTGEQYLTSFSLASTVNPGEIEITFDPSPVPTGYVLRVVLRNDQMAPDVQSKDEFFIEEFPEGRTSPQTVSGYRSGDQYQGYGYLVNTSIPLAGLSRASLVTPA